MDSPSADFQQRQGEQQEGESGTGNVEKTLHEPTKG